MRANRLIRSREDVDCINFAHPCGFIGEWNLTTSPLPHRSVASSRYLVPKLSCRLIRVCEMRLFSPCFNSDSIRTIRWQLISDVVQERAKAQVNSGESFIRGEKPDEKFSQRYFGFLLFYLFSTDPVPSNFHVFNPEKQRQIRIMKNCCVETI